tara:strand:- start:1690 stop:2370 length:681 start_codon:yes stop_codon:yes gene_type:complete
MSQTSFWQTDLQSKDFAELCNALYERELRMLANTEISQVDNLQGRLKSLPHYINRTAHLMMQVKAQGKTPLILDIQNASWSAKQASKLTLAGQTSHEIFSWYLTNELSLGLVVPILNEQRVALDCIDRIDIANKRLRTNTSGWFTLSEENKKVQGDLNQHKTFKLLKPNKKVMLAACAGHCWQAVPYSNTHINAQSAKLQPITPSLRELLLSCAINWKDFKQPLAL